MTRDALQSRRFSIAVVTVIVAVASCIDVPQACELVGCDSALVIDAPTLGDGAFDVVVESEPLNGTARCGAVDATGGRATLAATGALATQASATSDAVVAVQCQARGVRLSVFRADVEPADVLPTSATVTLTPDEGAPLGALAGAIDYDVSQPNGPDCEPTCLTAAVVVAQ